MGWLHGDPLVHILVLLSFSMLLLLIISPFFWFMAFVFSAFAELLDNALDEVCCFSDPKIRIFVLFFG